MLLNIFLAYVNNVLQTEGEIWYVYWILLVNCHQSIKVSVKWKHHCKPHFDITKGTKQGVSLLLFNPFIQKEHFNGSVHDSIGMCYTL